MRTHLRILAALEMIFGAFGILIGLGIFLLFGGIAAIVGVASGDEGKFIAIPILGTIGTVILVVALLLSLPQLLAGIGLWLEQEWGRILSIVVCALSLFNVPIGTALGIYGLWVLLSPESTAILNHRTSPGR
jgi:hypothetical protein